MGDIEAATRLESERASRSDQKLAHRGKGGRGETRLSPREMHHHTSPGPVKSYAGTAVSVPPFFIVVWLTCRRVGFLESVTRKSGTNQVLPRGLVVVGAMCVPLGPFSCCDMVIMKR